MASAVSHEPSFVTQISVGASVARPFVMQSAPGVMPVVMQTASIATEVSPGSTVGARIVFVVVAECSFALHPCITMLHGELDIP